MHFKTYMTAVALIASVGLMNAQTSAMAENSTIETENSELPIIEGDNWTFYLDSESKVYYIDFETISVNLSDMRLFDEEGHLVREDELWDLPVNTIYEIDFSKYKSGNYQIELRSFTGVIRKRVSLK